MNTVNYKGNSTKTGVYIIKNTINNRVYVGSTKRAFHTRKTKHLGPLNRGTHFNIFLQSDWNRYGEDAFVFEIVMICSTEECERYEDVFIHQYKSNIRRFGYNIADIAGYNAGYHLSEEVSKRASDRKRKLAHTKDGLISNERGLNKRVNIYNVSGELLMEAPSAKWIHENMGWSRGHMSAILSNRRLLINNHIILFANDNLSEADMEFVKKKTYRRLVNIEDMDGTIIYSAITVKEAAEILYCKQSEVHMCCSGRRSRIRKFITKYV